MNPRPVRTILVATLILLALVAAVAVGLPDSEAGDAAGGVERNHQVIRIDTDHAVYPSVGTVTGDASVIVTGEVISHAVEPGESPGVDALGDPLPAIPHTNYSIQVLTVLKGNVAAGATLVVALSGGNTAEADFVVDGVPDIEDGDVAMFFLEPVEGKYYPLAGGAAVAGEDSNGDFEMSTAATGTEPIAVSEAEVEEAVDSTPTPTPPAPVGGATAPPEAPGPTPVRKRCRAGFKKKKVKGKVKCVKKRHKGRHHAHSKKG